MNTKPAPLPYKDAPLDAADILMRQVQKEAYFLSPQVEQELPKYEDPVKVKATKVFTNWFIANVKRESRLFVNP